jgi:hypothetical protein
VRYHPCCRSLLPICSLEPATDCQQANNNMKYLIYFYRVFVSSAPHRGEGDEGSAVLSIQRLDLDQGVGVIRADPE